MRWSIGISVALCTIVSFPALFARFWADERFIIYTPESIAGPRPWKLLGQAVHEIPGYLDTGVFRPISRFLFYLEHWVVVRFGAVVGIPPNVVMSVVKVVMVFLLVTIAMLTIDQYRLASGGTPTDARWRRFYGFAAVLIGIGLVLFNPASHPLTLFPGLYLGTTAVALGVPLWLGRTWLRRGDSVSLWPGWIRFGSAVVVGAALASMIELSYLALPLGILHLVLLSMASRDSMRGVGKVLRSEAFLLWVFVVIGFLIVFIPTRIAIIRYCAELPCYRAAEVSLGWNVVPMLLGRIGASFFPLLQFVQLNLLRRLRGVPELLFLGILTPGVVLWALGRLVIPRGAEKATADSRRSVVLAGGYFVGVVVVGSSLAAISGSVQDKGFDLSPWRDTGFGWIGWAVVLAAILTLLLESIRYSRGLAIVLSTLLAVLAIVTSIQNQVDMVNSNARIDTRLYNEAGLLLVNFDDSAEGNIQRCGVIDGLRDFAPNESELRKMNLIGEHLDVAAENIHDVVYCDPGSP